jgi:hypothetical protein
MSMIILEESALIPALVTPSCRDYRSRTERRLSVFLRHAAFIAAFSLVFFAATLAPAASNNGSFPSDRIDPCANVAADREFLAKHPSDAGEAASIAAEFEECSWSLRDDRKSCSLLLESGDQYRVAAALVREDDPSDIVHYRVWTSGAFESYNLADVTCVGPSKQRASDGLAWALRILSRP